MILDLIQFCTLPVFGTLRLWCVFNILFVSNYLIFFIPQSTEY